MLGHHSSSKDVQPALNSSSGSFRDGRPWQRVGVLGLWGVLLSFSSLAARLQAGALTLSMNDLS